MTFTRTLFVSAALLLLVACAAEEEVYKEEPVERLYNTALAQLENGEYESSAKAFTEVDRQHPYSVWATKAQLMAAFSYYQGNEYDDSIIALDRFIRIHPSNRDVPYAYYLKALSYYEQISDIGRDQQMTQLALKALREIVTRFPNSKYSRDAALKIDLTQDHLAGKEMEIGRFYQTAGEFFAAIGRYNNVVGDYQTTSHTPEALHRLTEAYLALGIVMEAKKSAKVLALNFPNTDWNKFSAELLNQHAN
mgnify:CR=1 FL=1